MRSLTHGLGIPFIVLIALGACGTESGLFGGSNGNGSGGASATTAAGTTTSTSVTNTTTTTTGMMCDEMPCKLVAPQCGCEPGSKCTVTDKQRKCVPEAQQPKGLAQLCDGDCEAGAICLPKEDFPSACRAFCNDDGDCNGAGSRCVYELDDGMGTAAACSIHCDLITSQGCAPAMKCVVRPLDGGQWATDCGPIGTQQQWGPCQTGADCLPGLVCAYGQNPFCATWCDPKAPQCPQGLQCHQIMQQSIVIGNKEYGLCY